MLNDDSFLTHAIFFRVGGENWENSCTFSGCFESVFSTFVELRESILIPLRLLTFGAFLLSAGSIYTIASQKRGENGVAPSQNKTPK